MTSTAPAAAIETGSSTVGSARGGRRQPHEPRGIDHPLVVGHDRFEIVADGQRGREVDRVQRPEDPRFQRSGRVQDSVIDRDQVDAPQALPDGRQGLGPEMANRAQGFRAQQGSARTWNTRTRRYRLRRNADRGSHAR